MLFAFNFPIVLPRAYTPEFGSLIADIAAGNPGKACYKCFNSHVCAKLKVMFLVRRPYLVPESPWSWIHYVVMQSFSNGSLVYLVALNSVVLVICGVMYFDRNYLSLDCSLSFHVFLKTFHRQRSRQSSNICMAASTLLLVVVGSWPQPENTYVCTCLCIHHRPYMYIYEATIFERLDLKHALKSF